MRVILLTLGLAALFGCGRKANKERQDDEPPPGFPAVFGARPVEGGRADELPQPTQRPTKVGVRMPNGTPSVRRLFFSGNEDGFVALMSSSEKSNDGSRIDVARVTNGKAVGTVEVPFPAITWNAVSPDGKWVAVSNQIPFTGDSVTLFATDRPGASTKLVPYPAGQNGTPHIALAWIGFAGPDRLITVNIRCGFDVWSVPDLKRICGKPAHPPTFTATVSSTGVDWSTQNLSITPDRKTLILFDGVGFVFYDTATAAVKGRTEPLLRVGGSMNFWGAAANAQGTRFAFMGTYYDPMPTSALFVWDVATGKRLSTTRLPDTTTARGFGWWGADHLVLYNTIQSLADVMSVYTGELVGYIRTKGPVGTKIVADMPGDKLWCVFDGSPLDPGGVTPYLLKAPAPAVFHAHAKCEYEIGPDGFYDKTRPPFPPPRR